MSTEGWWIVIGFAGQAFFSARFLDGIKGSEGPKARH